MSTTAALETQTNPFPGLRPFREEEDYLFFGRENQIDAMVDKLVSTRFLAVVGTSGSGKSSLVNCGLRPALHGGLMAQAGTAWRMAQFRPGSDPLDAMARALSADGVLFRDFQAGGIPLEEIVDTTLRMSKLGLVDIYEQANLSEDTNLLVVVDQFEELFRYRKLGAAGQEDCFGASEEATAFVNLLLEAGQQTTHPIYIVLTMRSDFLGDCAQFTGLAEAINAGQYLVPRMTREERRAAISSPVAVGGAEISPVLLTRLVNDVGDNPDQLSILQHALNRTWARWQSEDGAEGLLDLSHYEAIGAMSHALDQHAEKAYDELQTVRQKQIGESLFKALTDKATDPRGIRRPTTLGALCALADASEAEVIEVIEVFRKPSRSFLMPPAGDALRAETVIDISHETLLRVWQRLNTWADEEAKSVAEYLRLADSARRWKAGHADLLQGRELERARDWMRKGNPTAAWADRYRAGFADTIDYLQKSRQAEDEKNRRARNARRILRTSVAVTCLILAGITIWAVWAQGVARKQKVLAEKKKIEADQAKYEAELANSRALDLIRFMDAQVGEAFADAVPVQLRERVLERVDDFYVQGGFRGLDERQRMSYHIRRAQVRLAAAARYEKEEMEGGELKGTYIKWERDGAAAALNKALRLGDHLAATPPDDPESIDRGIARDRIILHYYFATLSTQLEEADVAKRHLRSAHGLLEDLVKEGPFSAEQLLTWMGLPDFEKWMQNELALLPQDAALPAEGRSLVKQRREMLDEIEKHFQVTEPLTISAPPVVAEDVANPPAPFDPSKSITNGLGMVFVSVPGTEALFSVYETRIRDFRAFVRESGYVHMRETADPQSRMWTLHKDGSKQRGHSWDNPGFPQTEDHPVGGVSWFDAKVFCEWLTVREQAAGRLPDGWVYRLPLDAEWSIAAGLIEEDPAKSPEEKDRQIERYPWGPEWPPPPGAGNFAGAEADNGHVPPNLKPIPGYRDPYPRTAPVGSFKPNRHGLYDMGGNVWDWCEDWYSDDPAEKRPAVLRGASWYFDDRENLLVSNRNHWDPGVHYGNNGFRCVIASSPKR